MSRLTLRYDGRKKKGADAGGRGKMKHSRERSHCRSRKLLTAYKVAQVDSLRDVLHQRQSNRVIAEDADLYIFKENMQLGT